MVLSIGVRYSYYCYHSYKKIKNKGSFSHQLSPSDRPDGRYVNGVKR